MSLTHLQLREKFAKFWQSNNHKLVEPVSLIPENDPTTLFTGSGMQPLVPYLLGEPHPLGKKLFNIQPCFRAQDIEEVGDNRHTTFFEMMGNWSLGTYFKQEQLEWCWKFFTQELGLPKDKLWVTVFKGDKTIPADKESHKIWKKLGVPENRIYEYGVEHNWWSRSGVPEKMPAGEPGGPDSEVFYEFDSVTHDKKYGDKCHPNCECGRFLEIGNSVFMQYKKVPDGTFLELPNKNVDFGAGIERILAALNNNPDMFQIDVCKPIVKTIEELTVKKFLYSDFKQSYQVIADHIKAAVFLIDNGVSPSNKEQGYVLRRLIRRALRYGEVLNIKRPFINKIASPVVKIYEKIYSNLKSSRRTLEEALNIEEYRFDSMLKNHVRVSVTDKFNEPPFFAQVMFDVYQSSGYPWEMFMDDFPEFTEGKEDVIKEEFKKIYKKHRDISRTASAGKFKGGLADQSEQTIKYHTATHLLHQALYDVLSNVRQEGSNITSERLRFDFYSERKPTPEEVKKIEEIVNRKIRESLPVRFEIMTKTKADKIGARSFFKEKYGAEVKVYFVGDYSKEFCGGPHVENSRQIGEISIYKFEKIGSNLYRIYAKASA